ncbi:MAG: hypothetical protein ACI9QL_005012 [Candidatus Omnitrophota bacterium]|jgi:hypothetical protein
MKILHLLALICVLPLYLAASSVTIEVKNKAGEAAAGYPFKLFEVEVFEGEEFALVPFLIDHLDAKGQYTVKDLKPGVKYELGVGGRETARFIYKDGGTWQTQLTYIGAGDNLPAELTFHDITQAKPTTFGAIKGPMIYLEYWAVW